MPEHPQNLGVQKRGQSIIKSTSGFEKLSTALISDSTFEALHF